MPWLYSPVTGMVEHQNEAEYLADAATNIAGWSKLTKLPIPDSDTEAQALAYVKAHYNNADPSKNANKQTNPTATTNNSTANKNAENYVAQNVPGGSDVVAVTNFLGDLTSMNTWIRVAEVVIGGVLLIVGLAHITGAQKVIDRIPPVLPI